MASTISIADLRKEYAQRVLSDAQTAPDPFIQFKQWFDEALQAQVPEPNAMHLCTVSANGKPSGRVVLLKGLDDQGFVFFTNYNSRKGKDIAVNSHICLTFFWPELERQVRIEGQAVKVPDRVSEQYFHSRPRGSQIGAVASPQSQVIENRHLLEEQFARVQTEYGEDQQIPRPLHWGGYCVIPELVEFWQGRRSRLHDRIQYVREASGSWKKQRLAP